MTKCSIVIPVHNQAGLTKTCLDSLLESPPEVETEIVVVNDASTDRTAEMLDLFGEAITVIHRDQQGGFATATNEGAALTSGEYIVLLNNDTKPLPGWLDRMVECSEETGAGVVGAKLLFRDSSIQHAGVVICTDGKPRHIYAGFPSDHPAVNISRRFQAVTAACALVNRSAFEQLGGLDTVFLNGLEDIDLFLRLGEAGYKTHYCHEAVLYHLESVSRGRNSKQIAKNGAIFRERWGSKLRTDEFDYYIADGLLELERQSTYPWRIKVAPELATVVDDSQDRSEPSRRAGQVFDLLRETVRLSAHIADAEVSDSLSDQPPSDLGTRVNGVRSSLEGSKTRDELLDDARQLEHLIYDFQARLAAQLPGFSESQYLAYRKLVNNIREQVESAVPSDSTVLVISRGDPDLVLLGDRDAWHFPQTQDGTYAGHYPPSTAAIIGQIEDLRERGADHLIIPSTAYWWLEHYVGLTDALDKQYQQVTEKDETCLIYSLVQ